MENNSSRTVSISFFELLAVLFIGLKLAGIITWSWLWVLSPLWIPIAIILAVIFLSWMCDQGIFFAGLCFLIALVMILCIIA